MNDHFNHIPKSKIERVIELFNALRIIDDSIDFLKKGKYYHIGVIYSQLRSLLTDKTTKPLLFLVSEILNEELSLHYLNYDVYEGVKEAENSMILRLTGAPLSVKKTLAKQTKITLSDFLNTQPLTYKKQKFRVNTLIDHLANEFGGSHYSGSGKKYLTELNSIKFDKQPVLNNYIVQLVELIKDLGINTLKKITDFEILLNIYLPEITSNKQEYLFDFVIPNSPNRICIFINQAKFHIQVIDCNGSTYIHRVDEIIPHSQFYLIDFSHRITTEFKSEIKLYFNELELISVLLNEPLLMLNEFISYDRFLNRSANTLNENFEFGFSDLLIRHTLMNHIDRGIVFNELSKPVSHVSYFKNENFGYINSGEVDIKMEGNVNSIKVENLKII